MRKWMTFLAMLLAMPGIAFAYDVSYSSSTPTAATSAAPIICPANSTLSGAMCYCNAGYKVKDKSCVKDEAMPPGTYEIYEDVLMTTILNEDEKTCEQLFINSIDLDMCKRYLATPAGQRDAWKSIPRPSVMSGAAIANPWAPASQQSFGRTGSSSEGIPANLPPPPEPPPPPPPPPPAATTTPPASPPVGGPAPEPTAAKPEEKPIASTTEVAKEPEEEKKEEKPSEDVSKKIVLPVQPDPAAAQAASAQAALDALNIATSSESAVTMASDSPGLAPFSVSDLKLSPDQMVSGFEKPEPEEKPGIFARIFGWLFSIF